MTAMGNTGINPARGPWSQGKRIGQKAPFKRRAI
jgi:hypothetical protein